MLEEVKKTAGEWLASGKVDVMIGLKKQDGDLAPFLFNSRSELEDLELSNRYRVNFVCRPSKENLIALMQKKEPDIRIGIIARGCDERAIIELSRRGQVNTGKIEILGVCCTRAEAEECRCDRPFPAHPAIGEKAEGVSRNEEVDKLLSMSLEERAAFWKHQLDKCIKCYGCRNVCPQCFCRDCKMEQQLYAATGKLPPESPMFHFIRFYHLADRCIGCGECEKACPAGIPLLTIFRLLRKDIKELFDYETGMDPGAESPLVTNLDEGPMRKEEEGVKV